MRSTLNFAALVRNLRDHLGLTQEQFPQQVMLDADLAVLYGVEPKVLVHSSLPHSSSFVLTKALCYNALVPSWPEISRLVRESGTRRAEQTTLFGRGEA